MDTHIKFVFANLLESPDLDFTGDSENPIHKALGIKIIVAQLANVICTKEQRKAACLGRFGDVSFTSKQERDFVQLQILLNLHLNSLRLPRLPLLHLSPRMLLPHKYTPMDDHVIESEEPSVVGDSNLVESKKKAKRKKKKVSPSVSTNTTVESVPELHDPDDDLPALEPCLDSLAISETDEVWSYRGASALPYRMPADLTSNKNSPISRGKGESSNRNALTHAALLRADAHSHAASSAQPPKPYEYSIPKGVYSSAEQTLGYAAMETVDLVCDAYEQALMHQREQHGSIQQSLSLRLYIAQSELDSLKEKFGLAATIANCGY
jgi:hypothetical protein